MPQSILERRRWGDNDKYLGPITYAKDKNYRPLSITLASGCEEYPGASFRVSGFGHTIILALPQWVLQPYRVKVYPENWGEKTIKRLGRNWYWDIDCREFGFSISEGFLSVSFGRQTNDSSTEKRWGYFLPWTQWRFARHSFYGLQGEHITTLPYKGLTGLAYFEKVRNIERSVPMAKFDFVDFDGEEISATTKIEEREWYFGTGWFKWLSVFRRSKISRSLDIAFSSEVGRRKGSWKGGTVGHAIEMLPGELHEQAFRRYCDEHNLTFQGEIKC